jgi:hypothetical protein
MAKPMVNCPRLPSAARLERAVPKRRPRRLWRSASAGAFVLLSVACASEAPATHAPPGATAAEAIPPALSSGSSAAAAPSASAAAPRAPEVSIPFERVVEGSVHSIGFGEKKKAALGAGVAWLEQGGSWAPMPKPPGDTSGSRIFFGRDDQPRVMGFAGEAFVYLRFKNGAWKVGDEEIAGLAVAPRSPLYGVLGHADPEVVCKMGANCIIKRRSGWKLYDPPAMTGVPEVELCGSQPWAFEGKQIWKVTDTGFVPHPSTPTFAKADGLWAVAENDIWVVERSPAGVHHFDGSKWESARAPIDGPRAIWASGPNDVWIAGDGGAARFDGKVWSAIQGLPKNMVTVNGASPTEIWLGGEGGLYRYRAR